MEILKQNLRNNFAVVEVAIDICFAGVGVVISVNEREANASCNFDQKEKGKMFSADVFCFKEFPFENEP